MPRQAVIGEKVACPRAVAKIDLRRLRTSCQINYTPAGPKEPPQVTAADVFEATTNSFYGRPSSPSRRAGSPNGHRSPRKSPRRSPRRSPSPPRRSPSPNNKHSRSAVEAEIAVERLADGRVDNMLVAGSIVKRTELLSIKNELGMTNAQLILLMEVFRRHTTVLGGGIVKEEEFHLAMDEVFNGIDVKLAARLFKIYDKNRSGSIDYRELCFGIASLLRLTTNESKFQMMFDVYDSDGSGTISIEELVNIGHNAGLKMQDSASLVKDLLASLDINMDGIISWEEFVAGSETMPMLFTAFHELLPHPRPELVHSVQNMQQNCQFNFERLVALSSYIRKKGYHHGESVTQGTFRGILHKFFGYDDALLVNGLFTAFDTDCSGLIDFKELMVGLSRALDCSQERRAEFYFEIYSNKRGTIEASQLHRLLDRSHDVVGSQLNADAVGSMLRAHGLLGLDNDGDASISKAEFLALAAEDPNVLHAFGQVL